MGYSVRGGTGGSSVKSGSRPLLLSGGRTSATALVSGPPGVTRTGCGTPGNLPLFRLSMVPDWCPARDAPHEMFLVDNLCFVGTLRILDGHAGKVRHIWFGSPRFSPGPVKCPTHRSRGYEGRSLCPSAPRPWYFKWGFTPKQFWAKRGLFTPETSRTEGVPSVFVLLF